MLELSTPRQRETCARCHDPLRDVKGAPDEPGINCDGCHTIKAVEMTPSWGEAERWVRARTKYGSLCDPQSVYFHRAECLPLYKRSLLCGSCHRWHVGAKARGPDEPYDPDEPSPLPVFTTYDEWETSPYRGRDIHCQSCHMPSWDGEAARGWARREGLSEHEFVRDRVAMLANAIELDVYRAPSRGDARWLVGVATRNSGAGHALPAGLPARRIVLRVVLLSADDEPLAQREVVFGKRLVDASGVPAPFALAREVKEDRRLEPEARRQDEFEFEADERCAKLRVELEYVELDPAIAARLGVAPSSPQLIERQEHMIPVGTRRRNAG